MLIFTWGCLFFCFGILSFFVLDVLDLIFFLGFLWRLDVGLSNIIYKCLSINCQVTGTGNGDEKWKMGIEKEIESTPSPRR